VPIPRRLTVLVAAIAAAGLVGAGCSEQSAAVRVGNTTVSQSDFEAELDEFGANDVLAGSDASAGVRIKGDPAGSYSQDLVAYVLGRRVLYTVGETLFDEHDIELTDDDRSVAEQQLSGEFGEAFAAFDDDYRRRLTEDFARLVRLQDELGAEQLDQQLRAAFDATDIEVSSHYGSWDPDQYMVVPPEGPAPARGQDSGGGTSDGG
jgi:hypothetical protein